MIGRLCSVIKSVHFVVYFLMGLQWNLKNLAGALDRANLEIKYQVNVILVNWSRQVCDAVRQILTVGKNWHSKSVTE